MITDESVDHKNLKTKADAGDNEAAFALAVHFWKMDENDEDKEEVLKYLKQAADSGHVEAMSSLACRLWLEDWSKDDTPKPFSEKCYHSEESFSWLLRAAELGHVESQASVGLVLSWPKNTHFDLSESLKWLAKAALQGDLFALNEGIPDVISLIREQAEGQQEVSNSECE